MGFVGIATHDFTVLAGTGLALICVDYEVARTGEGLEEDAGRSGGRLTEDPSPSPACS